MLFQCLQIVPSRWDHVWDLGWISVTNVSKYFFVDGQCHHFNRSDTTVSIVQKNFRPYPFSLSISFVTLLTWRPLLFWMGLAAILIVQMQLSPSFNFFRPVSVPLFVGPLFKSQWHVTMGSKPLDTHMLLFVYLKYLYQWVLNMGQSFPLCLFTWLGWLIPLIDASQTLRPLILKFGITYAHPMSLYKSFWALASTILIPWLIKTPLSFVI